MPPVVRKKKNKQAPKSKPKSKGSGLIPGIGELHEPSEDMTDYAFLIYGEKSMGKTTLLSQVTEKTLVCMFEDRMNTKIRMRAFEPATIEQMEEGKEDPWATFKQLIQEVSDNTDLVDCLAIDTIDMAYVACQNHICLQNGINHPNDANDYGATWNEIEQEFASTMEVIRKMEGVTLVLSSHCSVERGEVNTGSKESLRKNSVYSPTAPKKASEYVRKFVDYVIFYGKHGTSRALHFRWADNIWTACGNEDHFKTSEDQPISVLHMPSKLTAGEDFRSAFNNEPQSAVLQTWEDVGEIEE